MDLNACLYLGGAIWDGTWVHHPAQQKNIENFDHILPLLTYSCEPGIVPLLKICIRETLPASLSVAMGCRKHQITAKAKNRWDLRDGRLEMMRPSGRPCHLPSTTYTRHKHGPK